MNQTIEVTLYAPCTSKLTTKGRKWWIWRSYPSTYCKQNGISMLRTNIKVDISDLEYRYEKLLGYHVVIKNKSLHRKLMAMSSAIQ